MVRLYRLLSEALDSDDTDDSVLVEVADIMVGLAEQAELAGEADFAEAKQDDMPFDLMDALAVEADPRAPRMMELMRERGWARWTRFDRVGEPPAKR